MEPTKNKGGRPPKPEAEKLIQRSIRMPVKAWVKIDLHGLDWLREVVKRGKPPKDA